MYIYICQIQFYKQFPPSSFFGISEWSLIPTKLLFQARVGWSFFSSPKYVGTRVPASILNYLVAKKKSCSSRGSRYRPRFFDQVGHQTTYASIFSLNNVIVRPTKIMNRKVVREKWFKKSCSRNLVQEKWLTR